MHVVKYCSISVLAMLISLPALAQSSTEPKVKDPKVKELEARIKKVSKRI